MKNAFKDKRLAPLIDFNAIVDTDLGLIQLIYDQYLDESVFDINKFTRPIHEVIRDLYYRKNMNPLYSFAKSNVDQNTLDDYYKEFMDTKYQEILDRSSGTNLSSAITLFNKSGDIKASILCHNKIQDDFIRNIAQFKPNIIFHPEGIIKGELRFEQYYYKFIEDCAELIQFANVSKVYVSTHHMNLNDTNDDVKECELKNKIRKQGRLGIYDMYNKDFLEGENNTDEDK